MSRDAWQHLVQFRVFGRPATFATARESAWKEGVRRAVRYAGVGAVHGVRFRVAIAFYASTPMRADERWDIDNLVKPTLDAAVHQPSLHRRADWLGIAHSPAYVREPEGNGMAEWFIRQLKEQVLWCQRFATVAEARAAVRCRRFREDWIVERLGYRTPAEAYAAFIAERAA